MRALILSVSAGGGHGNAAQAVKNYILKHEPHSHIDIIDVIRYINPILDKVIIGSYLKTIKITPSLYGKIYKHTYKDSDDSFSTVSSKFNEILSSRLLPAIQKSKPDVIICTHFFPTEMISVLKLKNKLNVPMVCILTDYAPHPIWIHPAVDTYIVPNSDIIEEMAERGVDKDSIKDYGIPINPNFVKKYNRDETLRELELSPYKKTILIMGGSLGMGKIGIIYNQISQIDKDIQIIVITGSNKKLFSKLKELSEYSNKPTSILGYTKDVNKYMQASDLLITKPGGLTITEAIASHVPLALFSPIPGQEEKNQEFLLKHNLAINLGDGSNCKRIIEELISSPSILEAMKANCIKYSKPSCGDNIYEHLRSLIYKYSLDEVKDS
ncbi:MAG: glycosyltransferase [Bacillota bacterium]|nr:glycosyltransferase [Bacillota bacterium]